MSNMSGVNDFLDESISLEGIYSECNEHLREQDRKRDQIIGFYGAIIGVIIGSINILVKINYIYIAYFVFILASWTLGFILINYMKWHTIYNYSAITLQNVMFFKQEKISQKFINRVYRTVLQRSGFSFKKYGGKTESKIFNLYLIVSSVNHFIFVYLIVVQTKKWGYIYVLGIVAIIATIFYIVYLNYIAYKTLSDVFNYENLEQVPSWSIDLFSCEEDLKKMLKDQELEYEESFE
ncbi:MAG: hypothetical protein ACRC30_12220 [Clostridium sp.]